MIELGMNRDDVFAGLEQTLGQVRNQVRPGVNVRNIEGLNILVMFILMAKQGQVEENQVQENFELVLKGKVTAGQIVKEAEGLLKEGGQEGMDAVVLNREKLSALESALSDRKRRQEEMRGRVRQEIGEELEESEVGKMVRVFSRQREEIREGIESEVKKVLEESNLSEGEEAAIMEAMVSENWRSESRETRVKEVEAKVREIVSSAGVEIEEGQLKLLRAVGVRVATEESILGQRARNSVKTGKEKGVGAGGLLEAKVKADTGFRTTGERLLEERLGGKTETEIYSEVLARLVVEGRVDDLERLSGEMGIKIRPEEIERVGIYDSEMERIEGAVAVATARISERTGIGVDGSMEMVERIAGLAARGESVVGIHEELRQISQRREKIEGERGGIRELNTASGRGLVAREVGVFRKLDKRVGISPMVRGLRVKNELEGAVESDVVRRIGETNVRVTYGSPFKGEEKKKSVLRKISWIDLEAHGPEKRRVADQFLNILRVSEQALGLSEGEVGEIGILLEEYGNDLIKAEEQSLGYIGSGEIIEELSQIKTAAKTAIDLVPGGVKRGAGGAVGKWFFTKTAVGRKIWWQGARFLIKKFGKEAVKQGVKGMSSALIKKVAAWGASTLAAAPSAGLTLVIMAVVEAGNWIWNKIKKPIEKFVLGIASFLGIEFKRLGLKEKLMIGGGALMVGGLAVPALALGGALMIGGGLLTGGGLAVAGGALAAFMASLGAGLMAVGAPVALAIGITFGSIFFFQKGVMDKAMILAPLNEGMGASNSPGGPIPGLGGDTTGTSCMDHLACRVQNILAQCTDNQGRSVTAWTSRTDETVGRCMQEAGIPNSVISTMSWSANHYDYLQCV